jgi:hypothetical protein
LCRASAAPTWLGRAPLHVSDDLSAGPEVARVVNHPLLKNNAYSKPIVAAVNGDCTGGGLELLLSTDIRAAVPEARFGLPEVGDLSVRRPGTEPIRSRIAAHCAYGDCLRPKLRWRGGSGVFSREHCGQALVRHPDEGVHLAKFPGKLAPGIAAIGAAEDLTVDATGQQKIGVGSVRGQVPDRAVGD